MRPMTKHPWFALAVCLAMGQVGVRPADRLVVHEWGTFTSLQDEDGRTIGGINSDDEPVPLFVHDLARDLIVGNRVQGAPRCHPHVTLRLETPVVYFHLPPGMESLVVNVRVAFRAGWLTQFYPRAEADAPGLKSGEFRFGPLTNETLSTLHWNGLRVGGTEVGVECADRVWTAPRAVRADSVTTPHGDKERFLFYRGVGHIESPIRARRGESGQTLILHGQIPSDLDNASPLAIPVGWLTEVHPDGKTAFRRLESLELTAGAERLLARTPATFEEREFSSEKGNALREEMHAALVRQGLFGDEARALLETWQLSYFDSAGLRFFYIVPPAWTDHYLPLEISVPAELVRVMVGRLELVTPRHRELLQRLGRMAGPITEPQAWVECHKRYDQLGRFRNALVLDEARRRPTDTLLNFIEKGQLQAYEIPSP